MECEFHLQDPTSPDTVYLFEAIIAASQEASNWTGMFAFASKAGVDSLIVDPETQKFLKRSTMSLLVGIDAVTNRGTLERLKELEELHARLSVQVFWNKTGGLFHPKVARFEYPNGSRSMIVGSGNLTPGGLRQNFEAFSVMRAAAGEVLDVSSWDRFLGDHAENIRAIDEEALERAARNIIRGGGGGRGRPRRDVEPEPGVRPARAGGGPDAPDRELPVGGTDRFLVARVPRAKARWHQVHFNAAVIHEYFRVRAGSGQRVYLIECRQDGTFAEQEPPRPLVYSEGSNKNMKIEIASHRGEPYPDVGRPVAVFRELQARSFAYMLLMPGEPGYDEMTRLSAELPSVGNTVKEVYRVITDAAHIRQAWAQCPLIAAVDELSIPGDPE